jgi:threonine efflux protein
MTLAAFGAIAFAFLVVAVSPGPANLACAAVAMARGRGAGLRMGLGLTLGLALWGVVAAAGLGAALARFEAGLIAIKLFGAIYLFWLAIGSARSAAQPVQDLAPTTHGRWFWRGLILNLSNPKAVFAWMAALAVGLDPAAAAAELVPAVAMCMAIGLGNYLFWALVFSTPHAMRLYRRSRRWIDGAVALLFAGAGVALLRSAAR